MNSFRLQFNDPSDLELATANVRSVAFITDYFIFYFLLYGPLYLLLPDPKEYLVLFTILSYFPFLVFKILFETFSGTTPGKRLMNLLVIDSNHQQPSFKAIVKRHLPYLALTTIASLYAFLGTYDFFLNLLKNHFNKTAIKIISGLLSKYFITIFAFVDLISINRDPLEQNRSYHDRVANTLVVRVKK